MGVLRLNFAYRVDVAVRVILIALCSCLKVYGAMYCVLFRELFSDIRSTILCGSGILTSCIVIR